MSERSNSPSESSPYSEVPTEPLPPRDHLQMQQYMLRRSHFLSDYEAYNPVQNMRMLAHHVFELSEGVGKLSGGVERLHSGLSRLSDESDSMRRQFSFFTENQHEARESIRAIAQDMEAIGSDMAEVTNGVVAVRNELKQDIGDVRNELKQDIGDVRNELKQDIGNVRNELKADIGGLRGEIETLRSEMHNIRQETQQGFAEIKAMLAMMVQVRG
ncbi:hypothetical protein FN846DRAFT_325068 [Sphaerosporella brunnea]|uniref:Uncharacterized protein n=1 Tax=Sphaerosporella brunnea TaxID=1250544 RepID=A0A5J5F6M5_9PEZI|nr:hypothetical protein FN846DRAFT_325068 [Sphaerosporella brunnea]